MNNIKALEQELKDQKEREDDLSELDEQIIAARLRVESVRQSEHELEERDRAARPQLEARLERLQALADVVFAPPVTDYRARTKEALHHLGIIDHTTVRPPLLPVSAAERENVIRALERAGMV